MTGEPSCPHPTPCAPSASAAAIWRPVATPPAASTGTSPATSTCGTKENGKSVRYARPRQCLAQPARRPPPPRPPARDVATPPARGLFCPKLWLGPLLLRARRCRGRHAFVRAQRRFNLRCGYLFRTHKRGRIPVCWGWYSTSPTGHRQTHDGRGSLSASMACRCR